MSLLYKTDVLYKKANGKVAFWRAEATTDGDRGLSGWRTIHGYVGHKETTSDWTYTTAKNVGKRNELSPYEQARAEADAAYDKKLKGKYVTDPSGVDHDDIRKWPMLAVEYKPTDFIEGSTFFCQPKLDGLRCLAYHDPRHPEVSVESIRLQTRPGNEHEHMDHIKEALVPFFQRWPEVTLDGELYNHEFREDFPSIVAAVKGGRVEEAKLVQFHVYDCILPGHIDRFSWRSSWLKGVLNRVTSLPIVCVQTHTISNALALDALYQNYLSQGYEGQMVRKDGPYEQGKRSKTLEKRKEWQDAEFPVLEIREGIGNYRGAARSATVQLPNGNTCDVDIKGDREYCREIWAAYQAWLFLDASTPSPNIEATVKFFSYTPEGKLRFGKTKAIWFGGRDV
jgi:DNA ligase-1